MHQRLVLRRVERVARLAELGQAELGDRSIECLGDLAKSTLELAVFASPADVVENRQQRGQRVADGEVANAVAVALDPLAVVGVFGLQPLQIGGAFGELGAQLGQLDRVDGAGQRAQMGPPKRASRSTGGSRMRLLRDGAGRAGRNAPGACRARPAARTDRRRS